MFSGHLIAPFFLGPSGNNHPSHLLCISPESPPLNFYKAEHGGGLFITARAIGETFRQMNRQTNKQSPYAFFSPFLMPNSGDTMN